MSCKGLHCDGCRSDGTVLLGVLAVVAVITVAAALLHDAWPAIVTTITLAGHIAAGVFLTFTAALVVAGVGVLARRAVRACRPRYEAPTRKTDTPARKTDNPRLAVKGTRLALEAPPTAGTDRLAKTRQLPSWWELPMLGRARRHRPHNASTTQRRNS